VNASTIYARRRLLDGVSCLGVVCELIVQYRMNERDAWDTVQGEVWEIESWLATDDLDLPLFKKHKG
jgi:hypothetical protein